MKNLKLILIFALLAISSSSYAKPISFGPFGLDTDYAATSATTSGSTFENVTNAITDIGDDSERTYIKGTSDDAAVTLGFGNIPLLNLAGDDLILYFLTSDTSEAQIGLSIVNPVNTITTSLNFTSRQLFINPTDPFTRLPRGDKYAIDNVVLPTKFDENGIEIPRPENPIFNLSAILVDLNSYGIGFEQTINEITVNLGDEAAFLLYATGNHAPLPLTPPITPVPVPAALVLFLSGLTGLGLFSRGRRKA